MKSVQLKKELAEIENRMHIELEKLKQGMDRKNFKMVSEASKFIYEGNPHVGYPRFSKRTRLEFMNAVLDSFQLRGIDVMLPLENGVGEAIYFDILGERVATLYGEDDEILFHNFSGMTAEDVETFLNDKIEKHKQLMMSERKRMVDNSNKMKEFEQIMNTPSVIRTQSFKSYRSVNQSVCLLGNTRISNFLLSQENRFIGKMYERFGWVILIPQIKKSSCQKRLKNKVELLKEEFLRCEKCAEYSEEKYLMLESHKNEFKKRFLDLCKLVQKYNIPLKEKKSP